MELCPCVPWGYVPYDVCLCLCSAVSVALWFNAFVVFVVALTIICMPDLFNCRNVVQLVGRCERILHFMGREVEGR